MKSYQKLRYKEYYEQFESGDFKLVSRKECFSKSTEENQYKQYWYYDITIDGNGKIIGEIAVRLPRTKEGEIIGKRNQSDLKAEERQRDRDAKCIWKNAGKCSGECGDCGEYTSRKFELNEEWLEGSNIAHSSEINFGSNPAKIFENYHLHHYSLPRALAKLTEEEQGLIRVAFSGVTATRAARILGLKRSTFEYRRDKILDKLKRYIDKL